jgi:hypothetical protein
MDEPKPPPRIGPSRVYQEYQELKRQAAKVPRLEKRVEELSNINKYLKTKVKHTVGYKVVERTPDYVGRPLSELRLEQHLGGQPNKLAPIPEVLNAIAGFSRLQCTEAEMAAGCAVSLETWHLFKREYPEVQRTIDANRGEGKISLRRTQYRLAETSAPMAIHLGKVELNQQDKQQVDVTVNVLKKLMELPEPTTDFVDIEFETMKEQIVSTLKDDSNGDD